MFPINFNFPYRKKDGSLITMEKALDGAGADLDLIDLDDVAITTPTNGDGLVYDDTAEKWKNAPIMTKEQWKKNGAYNLCPIDGVTEVKQAVTFTVNSNRTISANGTSTGEIYYTVASATFTVDKTGSYKFVGRPSDITGTCNLFVYAAADGGAVLTDSDGTGAIGTLTAGVVYGVSIYVASGVNISNKTFKPLLTTDLNATYDDYVPYAKTNGELTENVMVQKLTATAHATNIDNFSSYLYKIGNLVIGSVNFRLLANSSIGTELFTLGTVPKEYILSVLSPIGTAQRSMQITINTNGKVLANNAVNADWFTGIFIYKV